MSSKIDLYVPINSEHKGSLSIEGNARIDGAFVGNLYCEGTVVIGLQGQVEGDVQCMNAEISGHFKGRMQVFKNCTLFQKAEFSGLLDTGLCLLNEGALFRGEIIIRGQSS